MQVRFAFLCDYANQSGGGKINALGIGFDNLFVPDLSMPTKQFSLVIHFEGNRSEAGRKKIEIHLIDAEEKRVIPPAKGEIHLKAPEFALKTGTALVINYNNVKFPAYGNYHFSVVLDGHEIVSLPLSITQPPLKQ